MAELSSRFIEQVQNLPHFVSIRRRLAYFPAYYVEFDNGYTASIIGLGLDQKRPWQLAVIKDNKLCCDTVLTDDVIQCLSERDLLALCCDICRLQPDGRLPVASIFEQTRNWCG